jgi:hypothetical protein
MALVINDRVRETTTVTGTGSATLLGAVTGYQSFSVIGNGNTTYYTIADQGGPNWEVGLGTWSTGGTLARTTVLASSNSGSLVNFTTGTKDVFVTYPSENAIYNNGTSIVGPTGSSVAVANGGTGATTLAANGVIYGNGTGAVGVTAVGTTGQVLVGNTGAAPSFAALSSSAVTSITGTANQITASASTGAVTLSLPTSITTGQHIANQSISGSANQGAFAYGTLNGSDTGIFASYQTSIAGYAYMALQNTSSNAAATTDIALYNDTASLGKYIDIGINSSAFTGTGNFSLANAGYIYTNGGDLALGTYSANGIHFIVNNGATDAATVNGTTGVWTFASTITGSISGNAATATTATTATNATNTAITDNTSSSSTWYPTIVSTTTGNLPQTTSSTNLSFVPSTGTLTATNLAYTGTLTGGTGIVNLGSGQFYKDASGNVGIGTSSPVSPLTVFQASANNTATNAISILRYGTTYGSSIFHNYNTAVSGETLNLSVSDGTGTPANNSLTKYRMGANGVHIWYGATTSSEYARFDTSGNLGIGTSSPTANSFNVSGGKWGIFNGNIGGVATTTNQGVMLGWNASSGGGEANIVWGTYSTGTAPLTFSSSNGSALTERMRIDSSGNLLVGTTSTIGSAKFITYGDVNGNWLAQFHNTDNTSGYGIRIVYPNMAPNNGSNNFIIGLDSTNTTRFTFTSNGGLQNYQANNINLSDEREKKNISLSGDYLNKICAIPVKTFLYNDQKDNNLNLGVIAQDVQAVAPELIEETNWGDEKNSKMRLSIYQTDLQYALMKCIQELNAKVDAQAAEIQALKGVA